jgi:hypothetical protein
VLTVGSPKRSLVLPEIFVGSPEIFVSLPEIFVGSPKRSLGLPEIFVGSPKRSLGLPEIFVGSPKRSLVAVDGAPLGPARRDGLLGGRAARGEPTLLLTLPAPAERRGREGQPARAGALVEERARGSSGEKVTVRGCRRRAAGREAVHTSEEVAAPGGGPARKGDATGWG